MAIVIPSKYIFGNPSNEKVRKNKISAVSVEYAMVEQSVQNDASVHSQTESPQNTPNADVDGVKIYTRKLPIPGAVVNYDQVTIFYTSGKPYYDSFEVRVPRLKDNYFLKKITKEKTSYTFSCDEESKTLTATAVYNSSMAGGQTVVKSDFVYGDLTKKSVVLYEISNTVQNLSKDGEEVGGSLDLQDITKLSVIEEGDYFVLKITDLITGIETRTLKSLPFDDKGYNVTDKEVAMTGEYKKYTSWKVEITVNGDKIGIDLDTKTATIGSGNNPYTVSVSELLQQGTTINGSNGYNTVAERISSEYETGKETIEIDCAIADYYRENGEKAISIDGELPMVFENGDTVIPQKRVGSKDVPYSTYKDGKPKKFMVVSANVYYDGATMQKLYLLET